MAWYQICQLLRTQHPTAWAALKRLRDRRACRGRVLSSPPSPGVSRPPSLRRLPLPFRGRTSALSITVAVLTLNCSKNMQWDVQSKQPVDSARGDEGTAKPVGRAVPARFGSHPAMQRRSSSRCMLSWCRLFNAIWHHNCVFVSQRGLGAGGGVGGHESLVGRLQSMRWRVQAHACGLRGR